VEGADHGEHKFSASAKALGTAGADGCGNCGKSLLKHPFYQDWQAGKLSGKRCNSMAAQYYIARGSLSEAPARAGCADRRTLQGLIRENLAEEESPPDSTRSSGGILQRPWEYARTTLRAALLCLERRRWCKNSGEICGDRPVAEAVAALYAYERRCRRSPRRRFDGLKSFYGRDGKPEGWRIFEVHEEADKAHRAAWRRLAGRACDGDEEEILKTD